jgi:hypothetical protein
MHDSLRRLLLFSYLLLAICLALSTVYLCYAIEWRGPFRDLWEFIALIRQQLAGQWDFASLIEPYGGIHRIFLPRLLFYLDYRFASGSNLFALSVTLAIHLCACGLLINSVRLVSPGQGSAQGRLWLVATILLFFFSTTQIYNLIYISDNQVVIGNSLAVLVAWMFCIYLEKYQVRTLFITNGIALLACLSHGSSLMVWPAMALMMLVCHAPKRDFVLQFVLVCAALLLYVSGHDPLDHTEITTPLWQRGLAALFNIATHPGSVLRYISLHLSSPTSRDHPDAGAAITVLSLLYLMNVSVRVYEQRWRTSRSEQFWLTLAWYGFFIAIITAFGRQIYPNSALTDRYQTLVMTYWAALLCLLFVDLKRHAPAWSLLPPALTLVLLLPYQYKNAEEMAWLSSRVSIAHTAATTGITSMNTIAATLSHPLLMDKKNLVAAHNDYFREHRLAYFSDGIASWFTLPDRVFDASVDTNIHCKGNLDSAEALVTGNGNSQIRLDGHAYLESTQHALTELLVVDAQHHVIGLGRAHRAKGEFLPLSWRDAANSQWIGFINTKAPLEFPLELIAKTSTGYCSLLTVPTENDLPFNNRSSSPAGEMP